MKLKSKFIKLNEAQRLYGLDKPIIGLTGGIATGKSTVTKLLEAQGLVVLDADRLVKSIYQTQEAKDFIKTNFPETWVNSEINFQKLRELFFHNPKTKEAVEGFIYARLPQAFANAAAQNTKQPFYIYDVPLLFEKGLDQKMDLSVLVYAPRKIQRARLMDRDGHIEEMAEKILTHQLDIEDKKLKANFVIDNSAGMEELAAEVKQFLLQVFE
ncbi:dephospho-CoA kinase [Peredibacter starrii]|uniref:Dephospho-CoA kinase n=1 Tax=Peredibacter starrii TaxID=28202 RepID=A0AAX4HN16_9BACT|nr:dephospho-CoA kinase [Peredibacter starrii]WPU64690.1 dephospho-CoA kinase [Peredibacter starrii]